MSSKLFDSKVWCGFELFLSMVFLGTAVAVSSSNWMLVWLGLELNMVSFLGWMCVSNSFNYCLVESWGELDSVLSHPANVEPFAKYFLVQSVGSGLFLFCPLIWGIPVLGVYSSFFLLLGLFLKSGVAPLHQWFPSVCSNVSWLVNILLMFWQKIGPMFVVMNVISGKIMFFAAISIMNLFFGVFGAMGQVQLRSLFAYSSITHMGWMVAMMYFSKLGFLYYFIVYSLLVMTLGMIMLLTSLYSFKDMKKVVGGYWFYMVCMMVVILSIGGVPPFSGFFMKIYSLYIMMWDGYFSLSLIFCLFATMSLSYYLNIVFSCSLFCVLSYNIHLGEKNSGGVSLICEKAVSKMMVGYLAIISSLGAVFLGLLIS